jgi:hypothetical protein
MVAMTILSSANLPKCIKHALEFQIGAWSEVFGNPGESSSRSERFAVSVGPDWFQVYAIDRKLDLFGVLDSGRYWITDAKWCDERAWKGRCDKMWNRTDEDWKQVRGQEAPSGYDVYRDSLTIDLANWSDPVPPLDSIRSHGKWTKALCRDGLCHFASQEDSTLGRAAVRRDGSVSWWDGGYIKDVPNESELVHGYEYVLKHGHTIPWGKPKVYPGQTVATWYDPSSAPVAVAAKAKTAKSPATKPSRILLDSAWALLARAEKLKTQAGAKPLDGKTFEKLRATFARRKPSSQKTGDTVLCTETVRTLAAYGDGSEALLSDGQPDAILLADSSLALLGVAPGDSTGTVQVKMGTASRTGDGILFYKSGQPFTEQRANYPSLWKIVLVFRDGKLHHALMARFFDDC